MTERKALYRAESSRPTERDTQHKIVEHLRKAGWWVMSTSSAKRQVRQLRGLPDVMAAKLDHFLMIEVKGPGGKLEQSQIELRSDLAPHLGKHVQYIVAWSADDVAEFCAKGQ